LLQSSWRKALGKWILTKGSNPVQYFANGLSNTSKFSKNLDLKHLLDLYSFEFEQNCNAPEVRILCSYLK
jgi:hypothetical protein